ncbi:unnamed protein product [Macrosiphum euphorbiae]|uniref:Uncharacterized protein n=1 Tax=Macrosiphum euphorbiae TaxID=13131 RepID=A0AAV0Y1F6_9HEMI|nr:unnamed protein product [Macrosiphum euphorbiae]
MSGNGPSSSPDAVRSLFEQRSPDVPDRRRRPSAVEPMTTNSAAAASAAAAAANDGGSQSETVSGRPVFIYEYYESCYFPLPLEDRLRVKHGPKRRNRGFKVKIFKNGRFDDPCDAAAADTCDRGMRLVRSRIEKLYDEGFTHIVNMPGSFDYVCRIARLYNITVCDTRMKNQTIKRYSEYTSRRQAIATVDV